MAQWEESGAGMLEVGFHPRSEALPQDVAEQPSPHHDD